MENKTNMEKTERFHYTYSAKEQEEIKNIRKKYVTPVVEEDKMEQLRKLDASVYVKANTVSLMVGIIGTLLLGIGMSFIMTDIGSILGSLWAFVLGIGIGVVGILFVTLAYPIYNRTIQKERKKVASEILRLTDELLK